VQPRRVDVARRTDTVFDDHRLPQRFSQLLSQRSRNDISAAAWSEVDDQAYRLNGPGLGPRGQFNHQGQNRTDEAVGECAHVRILKVDQESQRLNFSIGHFYKSILSLIQ
jgi:hypothetical protein